MTRLTVRMLVLAQAVGCSGPTVEDCVVAPEAVCAGRCGEEIAVGCDGTVEAVDCGACDPARPTVRVELDLARTDGPFRPVGSGFLGDAVSGMPPDEVVEPLQPMIWRWFRHIDHMPTRAPVFQFGVGVDWGGAYGRAKCTPPENHPNQSDPPCGTPWAEWCGPAAEDMLGRGINPQWDLASEPNTGDGQQFGRAEHLGRALRACGRELHRVYRAAGREDELEIVVPSMQSYDKVVDFLFSEGDAGCERIRREPWFANITCDYRDGGGTSYSLISDLAANPDYEVDYVSVHMFSGPVATQWDEWLVALRDAIALAAAEAGIEAPQLQVNEYLGPSFRVCAEPGDVAYTDPDCLDPIDTRNWFLRPGHAGLAFSALQTADVAYAVKACWEDPTTGISGCNERALDGLVVGDFSYATRPIWHAYKAYAELRGERLAPASTVAWQKDALLYDAHPDADAFEPLGVVAAVEEGTVRALLGYSAAFFDPGLEVSGDLVYDSLQTPYRRWNAADVEVELVGLDCDAAQVSVRRIPGDDIVGPLAEVVEVETRVARVGAKLRVDLPMSVDEAVLLTARCP